jgi:hypothetical protein
MNRSQRRAIEKRNEGEKKTSLYTLVRTGTVTARQVLTYFELREEEIKPKLRKWLERRIKTHESKAS